MKKLGFLGIIGIVALFSISNLFAIKDTPRVKNSTLIKFSHKLHINDVGASCTDCHGKAASSTSEVDYLIPDMQTCFTAMISLRQAVISVIQVVILLLTASLLKHRVRFTFHTKNISALST
jgi:hypothetical protein